MGRLKDLSLPALPSRSFGSLTAIPPARLGIFVSLKCVSSTYKASTNGNGDTDTGEKGLMGLQKGCSSRSCPKWTIDQTRDQVECSQDILFATIVHVSEEGITTRLYLVCLNIKFM